MKTRLVIRAIGWLTAVLVGSTSLTPAQAEKVPDPGTLDARIRTAAYNADEVYRLHGYVGYGIELVFEEGERYVGQGGGDLEAITIGAHENHVIIKPSTSSVGTNLIVYTDRRAYRFDYTASAARPNRRGSDVVYAVRFIYPPPPEPASKRIDDELANASASRSKNIDYWYCGHRSLKPVTAFDDGVHTRLTFADKAELPALFVRNEDGSESLINFSIDGREVVVHRIAQQFIVRRGRLTGCIVNKAYDGGGERLQSGTVAPSVSRERREAQP